MADEKEKKAAKTKATAKPAGTKKTAVQKKEAKVVTPAEKVVKVRRKDAEKLVIKSRTKFKKQRNAENKDKRPKAIAKFVRISPFKVRIVMDIIRGKKVSDALAILENTSKSACEPLLKVLKSAAANAEHNYNMNVSDLIVAECFADQGPTLKRIQPVSKGRAHRINKRTSHITVILDEAV